MHSSKPKSTRRKLLGFTLIELMITIAIGAILMTIALPSFKDFILNQRVKNASFDLMAALTFTRSEALKRNGSVVMSSSGDWQNGWSVTAGGTTLRSWGPYPNLYLTSGVTSVTYSKDGKASASATFVVDDNEATSNSHVKTRCIKIDLSGRPNARINGSSDTERICS